MMLCITWIDTFGDHNKEFTDIGSAMDWARILLANRINCTVTRS